MNELLAFDAFFRIALMGLTALALLFEVFLSLELGLQRERPGLRAARFAEFFIGFYLLGAFALLLTVHCRGYAGTEAVAPLAPWRWLAAVPLVFLGAVSRRPADLAGAFFAAASLPCFDRARFFAPLFVLGLLFFALRAAWRDARARRERRRSVARHSIKEALDRLPDGVLFSDPTGRPVLANRQMLLLAETLTARPLRDGEAFWQALNGGALREGVERIALADALLFRADNQSWEFSRRLLDMEGHAFSAIFAACVTETDRLTRELQKLHEELAARAEELREAGAALATVKREQELARLQSRIHDMAGHRVYLMQQYLQRGGENFRDLECFLPLLSGLIDDLRADVTAPAARLLADLQRSFGFIGVELNVEGRLPRDERQAAVLIKILREASTNAVKHAGAARVAARLERNARGLVMRVVNDGTAYDAAAPLRENQGLAGMRRLAAEAGGTLEIATSPRFTVTVKLPPEENEA
ncbi:MAG: hypothetical protein SOY64_10525 [Pyramidobacter sp.]|uniref:sensor histidine kinase n=1 Tax=Pyramidobacter sp. TaxID=1943581 RepID=UPI002A840D86|nr:ATP-binding protein [Pyramidobacter sp.]MDY4033474.1 hypothetical protein [Pyramidobacter sp.]